MREMTKWRGRQERAGGGRHNAAARQTRVALDTVLDRGPEVVSPPRQYPPSFFPYLYPRVFSYIENLAALPARDGGEARTPCARRNASLADARGAKSRRMQHTATPQNP